MIVTKNGRPIKLLDHTQHPHIISASNMSKLCQKKVLGYLLQITPLIPTTDEQETETPEEFHTLLEFFKDVFQPPEGLPPSRECDHHILLQEGAKPPNLRTYCRVSDHGRRECRDTPFLDLARGAKRSKIGFTGLPGEGPGYVDVRREGRSRESAARQTQGDLPRFGPRCAESLLLHGGTPDHGGATRMVAGGLMVSGPSYTKGRSSRRDHLPP